MSFRGLIRIGALTLGLLLATPLLWKAVGLWSLLAAPGVIVLAGVYLGLLAALQERRLSIWQIRYRMEKRQPQADEHLSAILDFLVERAGRLTVEANSQGIFLGAPPAYDRYIPAQLARTLPEAKVRKIDNSHHRPALGGQLLLSLESPAPDLLRWATESQERQVRLHLMPTGITTLARSGIDGHPPGAWLPLSWPRPLAAGLWHGLPIWDEMSAGVWPGRLFPTTDDEAPYSSRSRLLRLRGTASEAVASAVDCTGSGRLLGQAVDGQTISLDYTTPLLTVSAPPAFLIQQAIHDLESGRSVVVISPHRRVLNQIQRRSRAMTYWLDQENARLSAHLAVVSAAEWATRPPEIEAVLTAIETFLASLLVLPTADGQGGLELHLPAMQRLARDLVRILAASARATGNDFAFTDLYAVSQNTRALKAFLDDLVSMAGQFDRETQDTIRGLQAGLEDNLGYVQITAVLSTIRTALSPIRSGSLHALCRPPFLNAGQALASNCLILAPLTNADFPEHDRFLAATLDAVLRRVLTTAGEETRLSLHLHDPRRYSAGDGQHWLDLARQDARLSLLLDVPEPGTRVPFQGERKAGQFVFHCDETFAPALIAEWDLGCTVAEVTEIPAGTALAQLPGLPGPVVVTVEGATLRGALT